jgi:hypothetical protein
MASSSKTPKPSIKSFDLPRGSEAVKAGLTQLDIHFDDDDGKGELLALWTLHVLDLMDQQDDLLPEAAEIWEMSVKDQVEDLAGKRLDTSGKKWDYVKILLKFK